jgi:hypothetical protein
MSISAIDAREAMAIDVATTDDALIVEIADGRAITVPIGWFPRLLHGSAAERSNWRLIGGGEGICWPELDEDVSVESLLAGRRSRESAASLRKWLEKRRGLG